MIPDKMKVLSQLHRLHHPHHHHHHRQDREDRLACKKDLALGRRAAHWSKKSQRVARKMSKLEEKLRKYKDNCSALVVDLEEDDDEEALSSSSINNDDAPLERADRRHHRHHHHRRRRSGGRGHQRNDSAASCSADSSDSSDSSDSDSDDSKSAGSSRSVSPRQRRRRHQHPHHHPHHHHQRRQRRGKPSDTADRDAQDDDGIYGCVYRILSRSEPSLHDESCVANAAVGESQSAVVVDLEAHSYCTARDDDDDSVKGSSAAVAPAPVLQDCEMMNEDEEIEDVDDVILEDGWKKIVLEGLSAEDKAALTSKYSVAKRAHILQGPRLNPELRLIASGRALERDLLLATQQSQLGSGLKALARGLGCLRGCTELEKNPSVAEALGQLEDASRLLLDAHRDASRARRLEMRADLRHDARDALDRDDDVDRATNDEDGWLFGGEAAARLKDLRCFKKCQRREERREARSEKGQKRKLAQGRAADQSKRTTSAGNSSSMSNKKQLDNLAELSIKNS